MATIATEPFRPQLSNTRKELKVAEHNLNEYMQTQGMLFLDYKANQMTESACKIRPQRNKIVMQEKVQAQVLLLNQDQIATLEPWKSSIYSAAFGQHVTLYQHQFDESRTNRSIIIRQNPLIGTNNVPNNLIAPAHVEAGVNASCDSAVSMCVCPFCECIGHQREHL